MSVSRRFKPRVGSYMESDKVLQIGMYVSIYQIKKIVRWSSDINKWQETQLNQISGKYTEKNPPKVNSHFHLILYDKWNTTWDVRELQIFWGAARRPPAAFIPSYRTSSLSKEKLIFHRESSRYYGIMLHMVSKSVWPVILKKDNHPVVGYEFVIKQLHTYWSLIFWNSLLRMYMSIDYMELLVAEI